MLSPKHRASKNTRNTPLNMMIKRRSIARQYRSLGWKRGTLASYEDTPSFAALAPLWAVVRKHVFPRDLLLTISRIPWLPCSFRLHPYASCVLDPQGCLGSTWNRQPAIWIMIRYDVYYPSHSILCRLFLPWRLNHPRWHRQWPQEFSLLELAFERTFLGYCLWPTGAEIRSRLTILFLLRCTRNETKRSFNQQLLQFVATILHSTLQNFVSVHQFLRVLAERSQRKNRFFKKARVLQFKETPVMT